MCHTGGSLRVEGVMIVSHRWVSQGGRRDECVTPVGLSGWKAVRGVTSVSHRWVSQGGRRDECVTPSGLSGWKA
eukprot:4169739-Pyramimonas_sp.AAC.1